MSLRRDTTNRLTLYRSCGTCGHTFTTTADTPFIRQVPRDGKRQATTYYCCESCYRASYKRDPYRKRQKIDRRTPEQIAEKNRRYYAANAERERQRVAEYRAANYEQCLDAVRLYKRKVRMSA